MRDELQEGKDGVVIYPSSYFTLDLEPNFATHHFSGLWLQDRPERSYKSHVHIMYFRSQLEQEKLHGSRLEAVREFALAMTAAEQIRLLFSLFRRVTRVVVRKGPGRAYGWIRARIVGQ